MSPLHQDIELSGAVDEHTPKAKSAVAGFLMRIHGGQNHGRLVHVQGDKCTVGRSPKCTLRLAAPEFQVLHCLIVRGAGGVVVRRWGPDTTLNGRDFTVSWMVPGDRLGIGSIELELLDDVPKEHQPTADGRDRLAVQLAAASAEAVKSKNELAQAQQFLDQLLQERQELLERLAWLQSRADAESDPLAGAATTADATDGDADDHESRAVDAARRVEELTDRCCRLEADLRKVIEDRAQMEVVLVELREEVEGVARLRKSWQQDRAQLEQQLQRAWAEIDELRERPPADELTHSTATWPQAVDNTDEAHARDWSCATDAPFAQATHDIGSSDICPDPTDSVDSPDVQTHLTKYGIYGFTHDDDDNDVADVGNADARSIECEDHMGGTIQLNSEPAVSMGQTHDPDQKVDAPRSLAGRTQGPRMNLAAMRDVANQTARTAIDRHAHRRGLQQAAFKWMSAVCVILIGAISTQITKGDAAITQVLWLACSIIAVWWFFMGALSYRQAAMTNPKRALHGESIPQVMRDTAKLGDTP
jgi:hypothetical protein